MQRAEAVLEERAFIAVLTPDPPAPFVGVVAEEQNVDLLRAGRPEQEHAIEEGVADDALALADLIELLHEVWPLMLSGFAVMLYLRIDAIMLRVMASSSVEVPCPLFVPTSPGSGVFGPKS